MVRKCQNRETGAFNAVKTILKNKVPNLDLLKKEVDLLSEIDHPHIIKLYDAFEESTNRIHLVTELCTGGELYDRVVEKSLSPEHHFSEYDAARILRNILEAIAYCHDVKSTCHRDLKVKNRGREAFHRFLQRVNLRKDSRHGVELNNGRSAKWGRRCNTTMWLYSNDVVI